MTPEVAAAIRRAAAVLRRADRIAVLGHIGPDGDALGSALGLALSARSAGIEAHASFGGDFVVPHQFRYLNTGPLLPPEQIEGAIDVLVACDTAAPERLGSAAALAERATTLVVIDHHLSNGGFGDVEVIDPGAAATAQLVVHLIDELAWPMTKDAATALYTGLVTDTGRFQYSATTPETHAVTARLIEAGVEPDEVGRHVYEEAPFGYLRVAGSVLGRAVLDADKGLVWSVMFQADLDAAGVAYEDTDGLIDLLRLAEESHVACLFKEVEPGVLKGSLRSRGAVDVAAIAGRFGGGGHHNAAGFTFHGAADAAVELVRASLP